MNIEDFLILLHDKPNDFFGTFGVNTEGWDFHLNDAATPTKFAVGFNKYKGILQIPELFAMPKTPCESGQRGGENDGFIF